MALVTMEPTGSLFFGRDRRPKTVTASFFEFIPLNLFFYVTAAASVQYELKARCVIVENGTGCDLQVDPPEEFSVLPGVPVPVTVSISADVFVPDRIHGTQLRFEYFLPVLNQWDLIGTLRVVCIEGPSPSSDSTQPSSSTESPQTSRQQSAESSSTGTMEDVE